MSPVSDRSSCTRYQQVPGCHPGSGKCLLLLVLSNTHSARANASFGVLVARLEMRNVLDWMKERRQAMQVTIKGKQMDVSPRQRERIEQKLQRLSRLVGDGDARVDVTVVDEKTRSAKDRYAVHLELSNVRRLNPIRATASDVNVKTALDVVLG